MVFSIENSSRPEVRDTSVGRGPGLGVLVSSGKELWGELLSEIQVVFVDPKPQNPYWDRASHCCKDV